IWPAPPAGGGSGMSCTVEGMKCMLCGVSCRFCTEKRVKCRGWHVIYIKDINDLLLNAGERLW
ncbi:hypothetical protein, partial [Escherichia coli]|uniref:hypothetical protein n=1 Tax=Escherichia coli TaxID=562 RepID=UPI0019544B13